MGIQSRSSHSPVKIGQETEAEFLQRGIDFLTEI